MKSCLGRSTLIIFHLRPKVLSCEMNFDLYRTPNISEEVVQNIDIYMIYMMSRHRQTHMLTN